jgi:uncharacterized protein (TIGR02596 family)
MSKAKPNFPFPLAFTLVELLAVVSIIAILAVLVIPAFGALTAASRITNSALLVAGQLDLARQTALAENRLVEVRVYAMPKDPDIVEWRAMQILGADGAPLDRLQLLPEGTVMDPDPAFSTLLSPANNNTGTVKIPAHGTCQYKAMRFAANGSTSLPASGAAPNNDEWFLSIRNSTDPPEGGRPAKNFATVIIDPVTGRVRIFRP